jgi:cysteine desulfurase family protein (TIGR01976 family)
VDVELMRAAYPALAGSGQIFFDNPAGTQIAGRAIEAMVGAMTHANANLGGYFDTSVRAEALVDEARAAAADFLGASDPREIVFGQNMTTLTFAVSRALGPTLKPGDEILVTRMDHDANIAPWLMLAEDRGLTVRWLDFDPDAYEFDLSTLDSLITDRTRIVAIGYASNLTGTIHDVAAIAARARAVGALTFVDAVQFAPHGLIDVAALGCDLLACSAYKFYGPHHGVLWGRRDLLDGLRAYQVRPAETKAPGNLETGTKSREAIAGVMGAIEHFAWIGATFGDAGEGASRRQRIAAGFAALERHERTLTRRLIDTVAAHGAARIHGLTATQTMSRRVPTVSFTVPGHDPAAIAQRMARANIALWSGDNYAIEPVARLGLTQSGGVVRVGLAAYNTAEEVDAFGRALGEILGG